MMLINAKYSPAVMDKDFIKRNQILEHINDQKDKNVILITAPAGYGKTTLLSQYQNDTDEAVMWYQIDKYDNETHTFLTYFTGGIIRSLKNKSSNKLGLSEGSFTDINIRSAAASLLNFLSQRCAYKLCIILDDFHYISNGKIIEFIEIFLKYMPSNIKVIISSRTKPRIDISYLLTTRRLIEIGTEMLKFSIEEENEYMGAFQAAYAMGAIEQEMIKKNNGWPFGLNLLKHASAENIQKELDIKRVYEKCFDNLFESSDEKSFLLSTCMLEALDADACNFVSGRNDSKAILKKISDIGLFITRTGEEFYKYHDLFRDYLINKVENKGDCYNKIAEFYLYKKDSLNAIDYLLLCGEYKKATAAIKKEKYKYISTIYYTHLISWNSKIPGKAAEKFGALSLIKAQVHLKRNEIEVGEGYVNRAKQLFMKNSDKEGLLQAEVINIRVLRLRYKAEEAYKLSKELYSSFSNRELAERLDIITEKMHAAVICSKVQDEIQHLRSMISEIDEKNIKPWEIQLMVLYGYACYLMGEYHYAMEIQSKYRHIVSPLNSIIYTLRIYVVWGQWEKGREIVLREIERAKRFSLTSDIAVLYGILAEIEFHLGRYGHAERCFKESLKIYGKDRQNLYYLCIFTYSQFLVFLGRKEEAMEMMEENYKSIPETEPLTYMMADRLLSQIYLISGDYRKAILYAEKAMPPSENYNAMLYVNTLCAVMAASYIVLGEEEKALPYAQRSMELTAKENYVEDFIAFYEFYSPLFEFCLKRGIQKDFVEKFMSNISTRNNLVDMQETGKIYIRFFGDNIVQAKGKLVRWRTSKAKNIFYYLLYNNNTGVTKDKLIDIFFEDYDLDKASGNLRTTITYIRKALRDAGYENILRYVNGRYFINDKDIITDLKEFDDILKKLKKNSELDIELCQQLCDIYKGDFCQDIDLHDFIIIRENYFTLFEKALMNTIRLLENAGRMKDAIRFINILIKHRKYNEEYYKMKIDAYVRMGDTFMAKKTREELRIL